MYTNASITFFHYNELGQYTKTFMPKVYLAKHTSKNVSERGLVIADYFDLYIPTKNFLHVNLSKDFFVEGNCEAVIDNTSEATQSASLKQIKNKLSIKGYIPALYGSDCMQHLEFTLL